MHSDAPLRLDPNLEDADAFYAALVSANEGLSEEQSQEATLRLLFLLANQIGSQAVLEACIRESVRSIRNG